MKRQFLFLALLGVFAAIGFAPSTVRAESEAIETGRLLAILLDSGRVVVGANQSLINDPDKGDKNFNPDTFEKQLTAKYKDRAKVDLDNLKSEKVPELAKKLLPQLVEAEKKTVADYQPVINKQGVGFKGFIPATFGTQAAAKFVAKTGVYLKQTTTDNLLRNPKNKADEFEVAVMKRFAEPSYPRTGEKIITEATDGGIGGGHYFVGQLVDQGASDSIAVRCAREHHRGELAKPALIELSEVDRLHHGGGAGHPEVRRCKPFEDRARASPVARTNGHPQG